MKTTDLFKNNRSAKKINESIEKTFGKKLNLENFDMIQLQDACNKLRTQVHVARSQSGFNENLENEALTQAQWMLDAINAEIAEREEFVVDAGVAEVDEGFGSLEEKVQELLQRFEQDAMEIGGYGDPDIKEIVKHLENGDAESAAEVVWYAYTDQDGGEFPEKESLIDDLQAEFEELAQGGDEDVKEGSMDELAAELGQIADDEDYDKLYDLLSDPGPVGKYLQDQIEDITGETGLHPKDDFEQIEPMLMDRIQQEFGGQNDDEGGETDDSYALASAGFGSDEDYGDFPESIEEKAPPGAKAERMVKHIKKGYADDGKLTKKEKGIAYATAWKQHNKEKNESIEQGDEMRNLKEGEIQQAQSIVTAKTMVDRVGRWIEELSGMENDTLLQLGDQIRDEMGSEQAKNFISATAPAIQAALENLKQTRETLATGVRTLTGEEQPAEMLGGEPPADEMGGEAEPDAMNAEPAADEFAPPEDEFGAADAAAGGLGDAGREQRESIDRSNNLLRVLAG
jgi:hypothetical protein